MILFSFQLWSLNRVLRWSGLRVGVVMDKSPGPAVHDAKDLGERKPTEICLAWYGFKDWRDWS